jgi:predicted DNA-binding transcriptional regulator AlpA
MALVLIPKLTVAKKLGVCRATVDKLVKAGLLPAPVNVSENRVAWVEGEIDAYIETLAAAPRKRKPAPPAPANGYRGGRPRKTEQHVA